MLKHFHHPLTIGEKILSVTGENDHGDHGPRSTGENAIGKIVSVNHYPNQGHSYGVVFNPSGVWVNLDETGELNDQSLHKYRLV